MVNEVASAARQGGRNRRAFDYKIVVGGIVILLAVAYLIVAALPSGTAYYITVSELAEMGERAQTQQTRVSGNVVAGTIERSAESQDVRFQVEDESGRLTVSYSGLVPDIFGDHTQVVVEGIQGADGVYHASILLAKCPSRFEEAPPGDTDYEQTG
jgi:cytochrome c-type biogenesis protein CcmE